jgi:hypothetical protein
MEGKEIYILLMLALLCLTGDTLLATPCTPRRRHPARRPRQTMSAE